MLSNCERFQEIIKQADSESYSSLYHVEPRNLPIDPPTCGQDYLVLLMITLVYRKRVSVRNNLLHSVPIYNSTYMDMKKVEL